MKKAKLMVVVGVALLAACLSAGALTLHDSEGFTYTTYAEGIYGSVIFFPIHVTGQHMTGEGLLFFDATYNAASFIVFESNFTYGWTLQGRWTGNGCTFYGVNNNGRLYFTKLYFDAAMAAQDKNYLEVGSNFK